MNIICPPLVHNFRECISTLYVELQLHPLLYRAGGSARVAKVLAFASFGLQILESVNYVDMSCNVFTSYIVYSCAVYCVLLCIVLIIIIHNAALYQLRVWFWVWS